MKRLKMRNKFENKKPHFLLLNKSNINKTPSKLIKIIWILTHLVIRMSRVLK